MKGEKLLSKFYCSFKNGDLPRIELEGKVYQYLLNNFERYNVFDGNRDQWNEFLGWFYTRLSRSIDLYKDVGSSFDAYMTGLVYGAYKEFRSREAEHYITEYACWQAKAEEMSIHENEQEYASEQKHVCIPKGIKPRQILLLLLKTYHYATEEFVEGTARAIGMDSETIWKMIDDLRRLCSEKEAEILDLRNRIHCQHYRCLVYQRKMNVSPLGSVYHERMKIRFERARKRFLRMKKRLGGMRVTASNRMIARVTGIPKGTVDTGLYALRKYLATDENDAV